MKALNIFWMFLQQNKSIHKYQLPKRKAPVTKPEHLKQNKSIYKIDSTYSKTKMPPTKQIYQNLPERTWNKTKAPAIKVVLTTTLTFRVLSFQHVSFVYRNKKTTGSCSTNAWNILILKANNSITLVCLWAPLGIQRCFLSVSNTLLMKDHWGKQGKQMCEQKKR